MDTFAFGAARSVIGMALAPVTDGVLQAWADSTELGPSIENLKTELRHAQAMLHNVQGREINNPALGEQLHTLRQLAYNADDVLDELEYFRIQDTLDGTYHAAVEHAGGRIHGLILNAQHTAKAVISKLKPSSCSRSAEHGDPDEEDDATNQGCLSCVSSRDRRGASSSLPPSPMNQVDEAVGGGCMPQKVTSSAHRTFHTFGKLLPCSSFPSSDPHSGMSEESDMVGHERTFLCGAFLSKGKQKKHDMKTPKLKFDRADISRKMKVIVEKLKPTCENISSILKSNPNTIRDHDIERPNTTPDIVEPELYGRENLKKNIIYGIMHGEYFSNELTIIPIIGHGGIGKTTFTQHVYQELRSHFDVQIWQCVSLNFNTNKLQQEIVKKMPNVNDEKDHNTTQEVIAKRLKAKRFLIVLDDMWKCHEKDWEDLLIPFRKSGEQGNVIIVTTRIMEVAQMVMTTNRPIELERLGKEDFMYFFQACVFGNKESFKDHPELVDVGEKIVTNLKGNPLAAKTVGRILRGQLSRAHWTRVLESKEWHEQESIHDIMPALKISYNYLRSDLQQCFPYCALYPEDYEFGSEELIHLWIGIGILNSHYQNKLIEHVGEGYLSELVNHGFFKKNVKDDGSIYYVVHDLLHELAVKVASECLSINISSVKSVHIPESVRHLSIIVDNNCVMDRISFDCLKRKLSALDKTLNVINLRTLMLFGEHHGSFTKIFRSLFSEARSLRTIYLSGASYIVEELLYNFSKLLHLRYLKINSDRRTLSNTPHGLSKLYHLKVLDLWGCVSYFWSTENMSNLINLRHFLVPVDESQFALDTISEQDIEKPPEVRKFERECWGFELCQLEKLTQLGGSIFIHNLENVQTNEEGSKSELRNRDQLQRLTLEWDNKKDAKHEDDVLENVLPPNNLRHLCIIGHRGNNCPTWLQSSATVKSLESFCLDDVSWEKFPPLGELWFINKYGKEWQGSKIYDESFVSLKRLKLSHISNLKKWVGKSPCQLFSHLEVIIIEDCPNLLELPFSRHTCGEQEAGMNWFCRLRKIEIIDCPKLLSLPSIPWTHAPCSAKISGVASACFKKLIFGKNNKSELHMEIDGNDALDSTLWMALDFDKLTELQGFVMKRCPPLPLHHLQILTSLKNLSISGINNAFWLGHSEGSDKFQFPIRYIEIKEFGVTGKELTQFLLYFPMLTGLVVENCAKIKGVGLVEQQMMTITTSLISSSDNNEMAKEIASSVADGVLLLPPQLKELKISICPELIICPISMDNGNEAGKTGGGGLQGLFSLRKLSIERCPKFLSSYSFSSSYPFPNSLEDLTLYGLEGIETVPLSNLVSLTSLTVWECRDLRGVGLWPLLAHGHLTELSVHKSPKFFVCSEPPHHEPPSESSSSKLWSVGTDDIIGILDVPICSLLYPALTKLCINFNDEVEQLTKKQEEAFELLTSLQNLHFMWCRKLQRLPEGLHKLSNLQILEVFGCQSIKSLPKDGLPSSLRELDIQVHCSLELNKHCRKLTGTIPIVRTCYYLEKGLLDES